MDFGHKLEQNFLLETFSSLKKFLTTSITQLLRLLPQSYVLPGHRCVWVTMGWCYVPAARRLRHTHTSNQVGALPPLPTKSRCPPPQTCPPTSSGELTSLKKPEKDGTGEILKNQKSEFSSYISKDHQSNMCSKSLCAVLISTATNWCSKEFGDLAFLPNLPSLRSDSGHETGLGELSKAASK